MRSYFHDSSDCQNRETCTTSDPSALQASKARSNCLSQDIETTSDLHYNKKFTQASESNTDIETAYEPMQQPQSRQSDNPSMLEINDPTAEITPQNEPSHFRGGKYILRPNPYPNYPEIYRY